jgi:ABC-type nitrate/sulfonate/bicarbonate transport system substrate-binding protein
MKSALRLVPALVAALVVAVTAGGAGAAPAAAPQVPRFAVAMHFNVPQPSWISLYVAEDRGFFKKHKVAPKFLYFGGTALALQAVVAGNAPVGIAAAGSVLQAIQNGAPITIVANHIQNDPTGVIVKDPDGTIRSWRDLAGKTIATATTTAELPLLRATLDREGLTNSVKLTFVHQTNKCTIVLAGQADGCSGFNYADYVKFQLFGQKSKFLPFSTPQTPFPGHVIFARNDYLQKYGYAVQRFLAAAVDGTIAANRDRKGAIALLQKLDKVDPPEMIAKAVPTVLGLMKSERTKAQGWGWMTSEAWQSLNRVLVDGGVLKPGLDVSKVYTNRYLPANRKQWR